jgi:hypothetical protein
MSNEPSKRTRPDPRWVAFFTEIQRLAEQEDARAQDATTLRKRDKPGNSDG